VSNIVENTQLLIAFNALAFSGGLLLMHWRGRPVNLIVPAIFMTFAIHMIGNFNFDAGGPAWLSGLRYSLGFIYGPLFFLYAREFLAEKSRWHLSDALHFVPALLAPWLIKLYAIDNIAAGFGILTSLGLYLFCSVLLVFQLRRDSIEAGRRSWIISMLAIGIAILVLNIATITLPGQVSEPVFMALEFALFAAILLLVTVFIFAGLTDPTILMRTLQSQVLKSDALPEAERLRLMQALEAAFEEGSLALDDPILLADLERVTDEPARTVSMAIQQSTGLGVPDWINMRRVRVVEGLIAQSENAQIPLLSLAFEAGFNSKATFNRSFKRHTGLSPRQYRTSQNTK
jgi:AraC-like DNA-binding protein